MNKFFVFIFTLVFSFAIRAEIINGTCGENATWSLDGSTLRISGNGPTTDYISPYNINATFPEWHKYKDDIRSVIVEEGITSLGSFSFNGYSNLESVSLPDGLVRIGNYAFCSCVSLKKIDLPCSLEYIGDKLMSYNSNGHVFNGCHQLKTITLPENLKLISGGSFNECSELEEVNWNAKECIADVMDPVLRYEGIFVSSPIERVNFGKNVKSISSKTFLNVSSLTHIYTSGSISFVGYQAFEGTTWETEMSEPGLVLYIDLVAYSFNHTHEYNFDIKNYAVEIKPGTKCITNHIFEGSVYLDKIIIPESIERIGNFAFKSCKSLKSVDWNAQFILDDDDEYNANGLFSKNFQVNLEEFNFGSNVVALPAHLLKDCSLLKSVELPESLRTIGKSVFEGCSSLVSLNIPNSVETLESMAISYCDNLETLTIGEGLKYFDYNYFLIGCPKLTTLIWNAIHTTEKSFDIYHPKDVCMAPIKDFIIGDKVEYVPGQFFWNNTTLNNISFGKSVKTIGEAAFRACSALTSVILPESLEVIGSYAFCQVPLEGVIIPENVTDLGTWGFGLSPTLTTVICCPKTAPHNTSSFVDHSENFRVYVSDYDSYISSGSWSGDRLNVIPMLTANINELSDDNYTPPVFTLNIPDYTITSMEEFIPETTTGVHVAELKVSCSGPLGDFSVVFPYRYTFTVKNSIEVLPANSSDKVDIYNLMGIKVFEGSLTYARLSLASGIYVVNSATKTFKMRIE